MNAEPTFLSEHWQELCERVGERSMSLATYLADSEPLFDVKNTLVIRVRQQLHYEVLRTEKSRRLIEDVLAGFSKREHRSLRILYAKTLPDIVIQSLHLFDGTLITDKERP